MLGTSWLVVETRFRKRLPGEVAELVDRIETYAGREILVDIDTSPVSSTEPNPDRLATHVTETEVKILTRDEDIFPPHGVLHELLHIERFWVEQVPQVLPKLDLDGERIKITSSIENVLEHLIIVPREAEYGFEPFDYWNKTESVIWGQYPWPSIENSWTRRMNCLISWLSVSGLVTDHEVIAHAENCLMQEGFLHEARNFAQKINRTIASKHSAVSTVLRFLHIPLDDVQLIHFDIKHEVRREIRIPKH